MTGLPVMRPAFMADPTDVNLRREESAFLLGADLLVVPSWAKKPSLPKGDWLAVSLVAGDREDPDQAKLLLRAGSIVPLGRVVQNTTENSFDPLTLLVCLDKDGRASGQLYEDAEDGFGYQRGDYLLTTYRAESHGDRVDVTVTATEGSRSRSKRDVVIEVVDAHGQRQVAHTAGL
jgi:alpha-glucosidase